MDLKTESIYRIKQPGQILQSGEHETSFPAGETLVARVEQKQGDSVVLRNDRNGTLINASMSGSAEIDSGDVLELAVSENSSGYLLYILDIEHAGEKTAKQYTMDSLPQVLAALKSNAGLDPKVASFLAQNNMQITPDNIEELKNMARGNSGMAEILSDILTGINEEQPAPQEQAGAQPQNPVVLPQTEEKTVFAGGLYVNNRNTTPDGDISDLQSGNTGNAGEQVPLASGSHAEDDIPLKENSNTNVTGTAQQKITDQIVSSKGRQVSDKSVIPANTVLNGEEEALPPESKPGKAAQGNADIKAKDAGQKPSNAHILEELLEDDIEPHCVSSKNASPVQAPEKTDVQNGQETKNENAQALMTEAETVPGNTKSGTDQKLKWGLSKQIEHNIKDMFIKPYEQTGEQIKKAVLDMPGKLNMLKLLLGRGDGNDKERYIGKTEQAQKQLQLGTGFNRFYYIELPFMTRNGDPRKAELYVQKNAGRKKSDNEPDSVVLISLDTQNIGLIETLIKAKKESISLEFRIERKELQQEVRKYDKALAKSMKEAGYTLTGFTVTGLEQKTTVMNADKLFSVGGTVRTGKIDVQI